jgi:hypothetical protein
MPIFIGLGILKYECLKPGALFVKIKLFLKPGPHHIFSFDIPNAK